jgi:hypothetical protein
MSLTKATYSMISGACANVLDFGADPTGATDSYAAIQAAIDSVCPTFGSGSAGSVYFPVGTYKVQTTLNLTNSRVAGTLTRDGLRLFGENINSVIQGYTGAGYAIADVTGSQWLNISQLKFESVTSTVGIYQGLSTALPQTQNQRFEQVRISMHDDDTANGGYGTIALWNFGAEENTYDTCYLTGNRAAVFTTQVNSPVGTYAHPYQAQESAHSLGVSTFSGETFMVSVGRYQPPLALLGVNSFEAENLYISNTGTGGSNDYAISFYSNNWNVNIKGTIEQLGTLYVNNTIDTSQFDLTFGGIANTSAPIIYLQRGGAGIIRSSEFKISNTSSASRNILACDPLSTNELISCYVQATTFRTNTPVGYTGLQENLVWNPSTINVEFFGVDWTYKIDSQKHTLGFNNYALSTTGVAVELCKVKMPTIISSTSAGSIGLNVKGIVNTTNAGDNARSTTFLNTYACASTSENGVITYGTPATTISSTANVNASGNNLTAVTVAIQAASVTTNIAVKITPTVTGTNGSSSQFTGTVEMYWDGWLSVGPTLLLSGQSNP